MFGTGFYFACGLVNCSNYVKFEFDFWFQRLFDSVSFEKQKQFFTDVAETHFPGNTGLYCPGINQSDCVVSGQYERSGNKSFSSLLMLVITVTVKGVTCGHA